MTRFAFVIHPLSVADVSRKRKYRLARYLPDRWVEAALLHTKPMMVSEITGIRAPDGTETSGFFVGCPLTAQQLAAGDPRRTVEMVVRCGQLAQEQGANLVGLGAFTSIVGDAGVTVAEKLAIGVTTGNSYTVATAIEGTLLAARQVGIDVSQARAAVLGATGSIGKVCARLLAGQVAGVTLAARRLPELDAIAAELTTPACPVDTTTDLNDAVRDADLVIAVTSAVEAVIKPEALKPGAVVCDVARPRDVSKQVAKLRQDVLVIEGGAVAVPGDVEFNLDFGFPPGTAYACMAETMILSLAGRTGDFSLGRDIRLEQVQEITGLAERYGFKLAGFRSFERGVTADQIARVREAAGR
ncbi:MAG TPA: shikimate dehydrogenase [Armatimonadota bacterium]